jgi:RimJ/RimL family protein N-acetyltransferase
VFELQIPILESRRLRLEPISQTHSEGMFELWSERKVCEHSGPAIDSGGLAVELPVVSKVDSDRLIGFWLDRAEAGTGFRWAVVLRDSDDFIGAVGFNSLGPCSEYAYHFVPQIWGRGMATEASRLALAWSLTCGATSIEVFIEPGNARSIRLAERLGFQPFGTPISDVPRYRLARADLVAAASGERA